ncbi:MAG: TetR/AcrR family transcriptional regulator [Actinomyces sp.]|jgi:AcrR family transcriptional regulator|nr:TetR/AcrR family transcriptional regulator [Actinomyces sp.]MCI1642549.1 TetR/AcrR family transcriptional regulator [Actinomyces sp.]MCI1662494.1 TetR/AcrR family transcriptional regulator [Actinomyces sp.]MCI1691729.1 TetR/AcrR family transcriptional regulator [Actinomyces sp.]MCI1788797.1 TetR/AcrR family transcriptional regulator [Actinomyces sp.]MCI1831208.1 TetR/AcrR family transcriptional regulator [Actinomyces sp.]
MVAHRRGNYVRAAIIRAALKEIVERGVESATVARIARHAGVHETTVYRRWGTRENLLLDAMLTSSAHAIPIPDQGSIRSDVDHLVRSVCGYLRSPLGRGMVWALSLPQEGRYTEHRQRFWAQRTAVMLPLVQRGIDRGELRADLDPQLFLDALISPLHARLLTTGEPPDDQTASRLAHLILNGATTP